MVSGVDTDESHTLASVLTDGIGGINGGRLSMHEEVRTDHWCSQPFELRHHICTAKFKFMVAQSDGIVAHGLHNIDNIRTL
jgi:hypothetical protein